MSDPKPSEILRPLLDAHGNVKGDSETYRDKLFAILDRLDAEQRRLAAKVGGQAVRPDPTTEAPAPLNNLKAGPRKLPRVGPKLAESSGGLEAEAREWAERMIGIEPGQKFVHIFTHDGVYGMASTPPFSETTISNWKKYIAEALTAFAARAIERHKAHTTAAEGDLAAYLKDAQNDLANARAECERLRGLIRDFTEGMTKTLGDGLPKGAVR